MAYSPQSSPLWSRRTTEWMVVALVLVGLVWAYDHEVTVVQAETEKVMVWSTLAALRAAAAIDQLTRHVRPGTPEQQDKNPFRLLQKLPSNYAGEQAMRDILQVPTGNWVYDPLCVCVGYRLLYPQAVEPQPETGAIWYRVGDVNAEFYLTPHADYRWFGQKP